MVLTVTRNKAGIFPSWMDFIDKPWDWVVGELADSTIPIGTQPSNHISGGWVDLGGSATSNYLILDEFAGHKGVFKILSTGTPIKYGYCDTSPLDGHQQSSLNMGVYEYWVYFTHMKSTAITDGSCMRNQFIKADYSQAGIGPCFGGLSAAGWYFCDITPYTYRKLTSLDSIPKTINTWYHVAVAWNGSGSDVDPGDGQTLTNLKIRYYLNGVQAQTELNISAGGWTTCMDAWVFSPFHDGAITTTTYFDGVDCSWADGYTFNRSLNVQSGISVDTDNIYMLKLKHDKEGYIRGKARIHQDEGLWIGAELVISGIPYTSSQTTQNTWSYSLLVTDSDEKYPPTYTLESKLREIDKVESKLSFTAKEVDYIIEHVCQSNLNHGSWGGVSQTLTNSLTITLGGDFAAKDILDDAIKLQGFTWYETPDQSGENTNMIYFREAGENASGVTIDEDQSEANCAVIGMKRAHDVYNRVEVEGSAGASGYVEDNGSQTSYGVLTFTERATLLNNQTLCNAMAAEIMTKVIAPPKRIKIRGKWKATDYGMLQPGETVSFAWDTKAWDEVPTTDCIIESFEMDLKTNIWTMILTTAQTYQMANDIQRKNSHLIEQNRSTIEGNQSDIQQNAGNVSTNAGNIEAIIYCNNIVGTAGFTQSTNYGAMYVVAFSDTNAGVLGSFFVKDGGDFKLRIAHTSSAANNGNTAGGNVGISHDVGDGAQTWNLWEAFDLALGNANILKIQDNSTAVTIADNSHVGAGWWKDNNASPATGNMYLFQLVLVRQ